MNKTDAITILNREPYHLKALQTASTYALTEENWNVALNLLSRLVRITPSYHYFQRLGYVASKLSMARVTVVYILAARDAPDATGDQRSRATNELADLVGNLVRSESATSRYFASMAPAPPDTPESEEIDLLIEPIVREESITVRVHKLEALLAETGSTRVSHFLCAELSNDGKADVAYDLATASLLRGDYSLANLLNLASTLIFSKTVGGELIPFCQAGVNIYPRHWAAWSNLGGAYDVSKRPWEAVNACSEAIKLNPNAASALNNLGNAWKNAGDMERSAVAYRRALEQSNWTDLKIFSNYLLSTQYSSDYTREEVSSEHFKYGTLFPSKGVPAFKSSKTAATQLRVGFLSPDLHTHSCAYFLSPLWEQLASREIEIIGLHNGQANDNVTAHLKAMSSDWKQVGQLNDDEALDVVRKCDLDVLIDPAGHTSRNRLYVFGNRAAPKQITWLGHPNTTGLSNMDYRVTDDCCDPYEVDRLYSESLYRLPLGNFAVYQPLVNKPGAAISDEYAVVDPPAERNGFVTFGSCNNIAKLTPPVIQAWSQILMKVPRSCLLLESPGFSQSEFKNRYLKKFKDYGVDIARILLLERDPRRQYTVYNSIDICLDPFPCNGGTTSFDLLWMGLPLVTLEGNSFVSRMGTMMARQLGTTEWIASDIDEYVRIAVTLADSISSLSSVRRAQRERMQASPLMDYELFADQFEELLRA